MTELEFKTTLNVLGLDKNKVAAIDTQDNKVLDLEKVKTAKAAYEASLATNPTGAVQQEYCFEAISPIYAHKNMEYYLAYGGHANIYADIPHSKAQEISKSLPLYGVNQDSTRAPMGAYLDPDDERIQTSDPKDLPMPLFYVNTKEALTVILSQLKKYCEQEQHKTGEKLTAQKEMSGLSKAEFNSTIKEINTRLVKAMGLNKTFDEWLAEVGEERKAVAATTDPQLLEIRALIPKFHAAVNPFSTKGEISGAIIPETVCEIGNELGKARNKSGMEIRRIPSVRPPHGIVDLTEHEQNYSKKYGAYILHHVRYNSESEGIGLFSHVLSSGKEFFTFNTASMHSGIAFLGDDVSIEEKNGQLRPATTAEKGKIIAQLKEAIEQASAITKGYVTPPKFKSPIQTFESATPALKATTRPQNANQSPAIVRE